MITRLRLSVGAPPPTPRLADLTRCPAGCTCKGARRTPPHLRPAPDGVDPVDLIRWPTPA